MRNLLIIDDNNEDMAQLVDLFRLRGHNPRHVRDFRELEAAVETFLPDGIILDLMFPPSQGIPAEETDLGYRAGVYIFRVAALPKYSGIPFVVLTGVDPATSVYKSAVEELKDLGGFRGVLRKPVEASDILQALSSSDARNLNEREEKR